MDEDNEQENQKRARAYAIWEQKGRPEGEHSEHWAQAEGELRNQVPEQTSADTESQSTAGAASKAAEIEPGDEAPPGMLGTGENICPTRVAGKPTRLLLNRQDCFPLILSTAPFCGK